MVVVIYLTSAKLASIEFFTIGISDRSDRNKIKLLRIITNLEFKCKGNLIFPVLARLWVYCQIINTNNSKEQKSTSRSVRSDRFVRNVYHEKLECEKCMHEFSSGRSRIFHSEDANP